MQERCCSAITWLSHEDPLSMIVFVLAGAMPLCEAARAVFRHRDSYVFGAAVTAVEQLEPANEIIPKVRESLHSTRT